MIPEDKSAGSSVAWQRTCFGTLGAFSGVAEGRPCVEAMCDRAPIILRLRTTQRHGYLGMGEAERARTSANLEQGPPHPESRIRPASPIRYRVRDRVDRRRRGPGQLSAAGIRRIGLP